MALKDLYLYIGKRIKEVRDIKNLTQAELSEKTAINRATISNIESGRQQVSLHFVYLIANAMDIEATELLPEVKQVNIESSEKIDILNEKLAENNVGEESKANILQALTKRTEHDK